jgi:type IV secretory pathway TrbF-like protein
MSHTCAVGSDVAKRDANGHQNQTTPRAKHWRRHVITVLLLAVVIVTGSMVYFSRQQWRDMYMSVIHR